MSYRVYMLDLSLATDDTAKQELVPHNQKITEVALLSIPDGVSIRLGFGDSQLFTVSDPISFEPLGEDDQQRGLYWSNPVALPGTVLELIVASGGTGGGN